MKIITYQGPLKLIVYTISFEKPTGSNKKRSILKLGKRSKETLLI
jgi:hypothetical protein